MNDSINIEAGDMGLVIAFVLLIGGIIKNFTPVNNRYIPLITWVLGGLLYQWLAGGWSDPRQWMMALISVAGATGLHAATKSTLEKPDGGEPGIAPRLQSILLIGFLSFGLMFGVGGCVPRGGAKPTPQAVAYLTLAQTKSLVDNAEKVYGNQVALGHVSNDKQAEIDAKIVTFHQRFGLAVRIAKVNYAASTPADVQALADQLVSSINLLAR